MKSILMLLAMTLVPMLSYANNGPRCDYQVKAAVEGRNMFHVVEQIHTTDGVNYVVIFRTASGDAEQASMAIVTVDANNCKIRKVTYVRGAH